MGRGRGRGGTGLREGGRRTGVSAQRSITVASAPARRGPRPPQRPRASRRLLRAATDGPGGAATFPRAGGGGEARPRLAAGQSPAAGPPRDAAPPTAAAVVTLRHRAPPPALPECTRARGTAPRTSPGSRPALGPVRGVAELGLRGRQVRMAAALLGGRVRAGVRLPRFASSALPSAVSGGDPWLAESRLPLRSERLGSLMALVQSCRDRAARDPLPGALPRAVMALGAQSGTRWRWHHAWPARPRAHRLGVVAAFRTPFAAIYCQSHPPPVPSFCHLA